MKLYKIQRNSDGLFSLGGEAPQKFSKKGKLWSAMGHVVSHLNYVNKGAAAFMSLIEYDINEKDGSMTVIKRTPLIEVKDAAAARKQKVKDRDTVRRLKSEIKACDEARAIAANKLWLLRGGKRG